MLVCCAGSASYAQGQDNQTDPSAVKSVSVGWDDVKKNWENAFTFWSRIKVTQTAGPYVRVDGNVAWSTGLTNTNAKAKNGTSLNLPTFESDVLRKDGDGEWKLEAHSAWRAAQ